MEEQIISIDKSKFDIVHDKSSPAVTKALEKKMNWERLVSIILITISVNVLIYEIFLNLTNCKFMYPHCSYYNIYFNESVYRMSKLRFTNPLPQKLYEIKVPIKNPSEIP